MKLLHGQPVATKIESALKKRLNGVSRPPGLAFVLVGNNPAAELYVRLKKRKCTDVGIASRDTTFPATVSEQELLLHIEGLNRDPTVDGILVQLPLPRHIPSAHVTAAIDPSKDVDGFHPFNIGKLLLGEKPMFIPCTPLGIQTLLVHYDIPLEGKHVVIIGRSNIVGKPLAALLMQKAPHANATVTVANSATSHLPEITRTADILITAMGNPHFLKADMVRKGSVVIDVGITRVGRAIVGDVDFDRVAPLTSAITPVPGGIGPMTIAMLMSNTIEAFFRHKEFH
jgi:methylenetetrahydrofolate dehydrogenase (NADP+)/methenyltetrahydrofolate cyclohydrolase